MAVPRISIVMPVLNEAASVERTYRETKAALAKAQVSGIEFIFVDDGSTDGSADILRRLAARDKRVRLLSFTRNFGKELATTAGIRVARGEGVLIMDADGQHPPAEIPRLIREWRQGAPVVVGVRRDDRGVPLGKRLGSKLFYGVLRRIVGIRVMPRATDFRLIDRSVQREFAKLNEVNRITRGLIDWLGFEQRYVPFTAPRRAGGTPVYSLRQLIRLAVNSFVSLSFTPLFLSGYAGLVITPIAFLLGTFIIVEQYLLDDPLGLNITGTGSLSVLLLFLIGITLISQGLMALYLSHIYTETRGRPLYVIDERRSVRPSGR